MIPIRPSLRARLARPLLASLLAALASLLVAGPALADRLITTDKRILDVKKARKAEDGSYVLEFEYGTVHCPASLVASVEIEGDMSDYVPKDDREKAMLEKGYVRYRDRWLSKPAYQAELDKEAEKQRERVDELEAHANFFDGWTKETRHFRFQTNTSPELLDYYADLLEAYYDLMDKRVGIRPTPTLRRTKMKVNIYKSRKEFQEANSTAPGVAGFFSFQQQSLNFYHDYEEPDVSNWIALHECTHLLTYLIEPQSWPRIWINEGVADYFGSSTIERDSHGKIEIIPGKLQVDRILTVQQAIKDDKFVPLETLFKIDKGNFGAFQYAHAWSFVYFLNNANKKYEKGFRKFFKDNYTIPKGVKYTWEPFPNVQGTAKVIPAEEVRRVLLDDLKVKDDEVPELQQEWLDFIAGIKIDAPLARFKRAYRTLLGYQAGDMDEAQKDLDFAIDAGIKEPRAYWARAMVGVLRGGAPSAAIPDIEKAVEMDPLNAGYHYALAGLLSGHGIGTSLVRVTFKYSDDSHWNLPKTAEEVERIRSEYGLAHDLDPDNEVYRDELKDFLEAYSTWKEDSDG